MAAISFSDQGSAIRDQRTAISGRRQAGTQVTPGRDAWRSKSPLPLCLERQASEPAVTGVEAGGTPRNCSVGDARQGCLALQEVAGG
jgi:hypothetical protein